MAVMSFAHLKNNKAPVSPSRKTETPAAPAKTAAGVISFAHLKAGNKKPAVVQGVMNTKSRSP